MQLAVGWSFESLVRKSIGLRRMSLRLWYEPDHGVLDMKRPFVRLEKPESSPGAFLPGAPWRHRFLYSKAYGSRADPAVTPDHKVNRTPTP